MVYTKEVIIMNNAKMLAASLAKAVAEKALRRDANQTTCSAIFQPKIPLKLSSFKKHKA